VLSGYLGLAAQAEVVGDIVRKVKAANPKAIYCLDPVFGDDGRAYAKPGVAEAMARTLRPGGTLTVVDNVAFGLVREPAQAARAENGGATLEHYRNDDSTRAHRVIASSGRFIPLEARAVRPGTSNQWLLRYRLEG